MKKPRRPAVFLDRDGTLNVERNYLFKIADFQWVDGAVDAVRRLNELNFWVIVVTNQAGIARGYYQPQDMRRLHDFMGAELAKAGARIDGFYHCPHHPEAGDVRDCPCRKPKTGMIDQARADFDIDMAASYLVGDRVQDVETARAAGLKPVLVLTGYGAEDQAKLTGAPVPVVKDIKAAQELIEQQMKNGATP
jgi:D-glycero-D-manno-heptose 1,7-bisphosphate phosphatase